MSWSVMRIGRPAAVRRRLAEDFGKNPCTEPEESIRQAVALQMDKALEGMGQQLCVKCSASGSQWKAAEGDVRNTLSVEITVLGELELAET